MQKLRAEKGITLIALVITIIVMLILVGVSVTVALKGGLFTTAKQAKENTATERDKELNISEGKVTINGEEYNSIDEYVSGVSSNNPENPTNPEEPTEPENPTNPSEQGKVTITPKKETYAIGEAVAIGEESFYVIADDAEKVTLLAKDVINTETLVQDVKAYTVKFSSTNYWSSIEGITYPYDLNDTPTSVDTDAIAKAIAYGTNLGGTGRLMTYEEATALQTANSDILYGTNGKSSTEYGLNYWLSSAYDVRSVWVLWGSFSNLDEVRYNGDDFGYQSVRPVVEILKANIS